MIGKDESVEDEVPIVGDVTKVAAETVVFFAICGFGAKALGTLIMHSEQNI